jgi:N-acyl-D-amino-acid deacylase
MLDILIQNGQVVDGSGAPRYRADVGIQAGHIVEVGTLDGPKPRPCSMPMAAS